MKKALIALFAVVLLAPAALACGGPNCMFLSPMYAVCSGGSPDDGNWCIVVCENGLCTCEDVACDDGGGGGGRIPASARPAGQYEAYQHGRAWGQDRLSKFRGLTQAEAAAKCSVTPGCSMSNATGLLVNTPQTWGRLKVMYR